MSKKMTYLNANDDNIRWFAKKMAAALQIPESYLFPELYPQVPYDNSERNWKR